MFYIGHFSFVEPNVDAAGFGDDVHGLFTLVADAENVEEAVKTFRNLILQLRKDGDIFDEVTEIFLDSCVECISIPDSGFLVHYVVSFGSLGAKISSSVHGATEEQAIAYGFGVEVPDNNGEYADEPFLVFDET